MQQEIRRNSIGLSKKKRKYSKLIYLKKIIINLNFLCKLFSLCLEDSHFLPIKLFNILCASTKIWTLDRRY